MKNEVRELYTPEILSWQYLQNETSNIGGLFFCKVNDELVASQGMIPLMLTAENESFLSAKSESSFLLPAHRGKGLFEKLYEESMAQSESRGVQLFWGFTALSKVWRDKLNFDVYDGVISEAVIQVSLRNKLKWIRMKKGTAAASGKALFIGFKNVFQRKFRHTLRVEEMDLSTQNGEESFFDLYSLWKQKNPSFIHLTLSKAFVDWRIRKNPVLHYRFIGVYTADTLVAIGIVNITNPINYLVGFIALDQDQTKAYISALCDFCYRSYGTADIVYWANSLNRYNAAILDSMRCLGARIHQNNQMNFVLRASKEFKTKQRSLDIKDFCINGLWTEGFKI